MQMLVHHSFRLDLAAPPGYCMEPAALSCTPISQHVPLQQTHVIEHAAMQKEADGQLE